MTTKLKLGALLMRKLCLKKFSVSTLKKRSAEKEHSDPLELLFFLKVICSMTIKDHTLGLIGSP